VRELRAWTRWKKEWKDLYRVEARSASSKWNFGTYRVFDNEV
jgi:hypothetical protein